MEKYCPDLEGLLDYELPMARRYRRFLSLAIVQTDGWSLDCADRLEGIVKGAVRRSDAVCRYRDGTFALLLGETSKEGALKALRRCCAGLDVGFHSSVSSFPIDGQSVEGLIDSACRRLDRARHMGQGAIVADG